MYKWLLKLALGKVLSDPSKVVAFANSELADSAAHLADLQTKLSQTYASSAKVADLQLQKLVWQVRQGLATELLRIVPGQVAGAVPLTTVPVDPAASTADIVAAVLAEVRKTLPVAAVPAPAIVVEPVTFHSIGAAAPKSAV